MSISKLSSAGLKCMECPAYHLCLPVGLSDEELKLLDPIISKSLSFKPGDSIYQLNQKMENLYAVMGGSCKEFYIDINGNEYINQFYFTGDIMGLESIPNRKYRFSMTALTTIELCVIPVEPLLALANKTTTLFHRLINIMSYKMQNDQHIRYATNASQRLADFLLNVYLRHKERHAQENQLRLPMSQFDIGNMLGLAYETVSRMLRKLHEEKIIEIRGKEIIIINEHALRELSSYA